MPIQIGTATKDGWVVVQQVQFPADHTGGYFSESYIVEKEKKRAFLKLLDVSVFGTLANLQQGLAEFSYETHLAKYSVEKKLARIVRLLESGELEVDPANTVPFLRTVPYLVFELGVGDIRGTVDVSKSVTNRWRFCVLHRASAALLQLHQANVAHQDLKPSNVIQIASDDLKLADLGRSTMRGLAAPHDVYDIPGSKRYAPYELRYSYLLPDWQRRIATDVFHVGCLAVFVFTNVVLPGMVFDELEPPYRPDAWGDPYLAVVPHIQSALARSLHTLSNDFPAPFRDELVGIVGDMCHPDPSLRGSGKGPRSDVGTAVWLQRFVSRFDILAKRAGVIEAVANV